MKTLTKFIRLVAPALIMGSVLSGCSSDVAPGQVTPNEYKRIVLDADSKAAADGLTDFYTEFTAAAVSFIDNDDKVTDKNIIVSPLSMAVLLSMTANGTDGEERQMVLDYLGVDDTNSLNSLVKTLLEKLPEADNQTKFLSVNSVWVNNLFILNDSFSSFMSDSYRADINMVNFSDRNITNRINQWCSGMTNGLIPNVVDNISQDCLAMLINAMYFQGKWDKDLEFLPVNTKKREFRGVTTTSEVDMMHANEFPTVYYADENLDAFYLPFGNGAFTMMILVPDENLTSDQVNSLITPQLLNDAKNKITPGILDITIPKFKLTSKFSVNDILGHSGLALRNMNLSMFNPSVRGVLDINHASSFGIDEDGVIAAAVSSGEIWNGANLDVDHNKIIVDRPFYFFINEVSTGACILSGRIADL